MSNPLFGASAIPVCEQVVNFAQARHTILASNVANSSTPGYRARDLSPELFQRRLQEAIENKQAPRPQSDSLHGEELPLRRDFADVRETAQTILYHDDSDISMEQQVAEINKNQVLHNTALTIMISQFNLLQAAISERA